MAEADAGRSGGMSTADLLKAHFGPTRGEVIGIGEAGNAYEPDHPLGGRAAFWELMCAACEVEVDPETGETTIHKLVLVSDVGKALNPHQVEAQDEGAAVMGLGHTLMEQLVLGARRPDPEPRLARLPNSFDQGCAARTRHRTSSRTRDGPGPYGAKGAGEGGTLAVAAAIGAAINQAAGVDDTRSCRSRRRRSGGRETKNDERKTNRAHAALDAPGSPENRISDEHAVRRIPVRLAGRTRLDAHHSCRRMHANPRDGRIAAAVSGLEQRRNLRRLPHVLVDLLIGERERSRRCGGWDVCRPGGRRALPQ